MKILYDHQIFSRQKFGGISRYFNELMKLNDPGLEIISHITEYKDQKTVKRDVISRSVRYALRKTGLEKKHIPYEAPAEMKALLKTDYDIFHPTYFDPYFLELTSKPFVLTVFDMIHEIYPEYFGISDPTSRQKRLLCDKADAILAISANTKHDLVDIFNIPEEKVHVTYLASDFDLVSAKQPEGAGDFKNYILFTGSRWTYKNFYFPLRALSELLRNDRSLQLVCTGHAFNKEELELFNDLAIAAQVHHIFLKDDHELAWIYQHAALFIFPSLYEGFGFPMLEAFASKCPVVASRGSSLQEIGADGALYFDPKNLAQIRDRAYSALYDQQLRKQLIDNGNKIFKRYNWNRCREETLNIYSSVYNHSH